MLKKLYELEVGDYFYGRKDGHPIRALWQVKKKSKSSMEVELIWTIIKDEVKYWPLGHKKVIEAYSQTYNEWASEVMAVGEKYYENLF